VTKVGLISTRATNVGDDLIRAGIEALLRSLLAPADLEFALVNKHEPLEVYLRGGPAGCVRRLPRGRRVASRAVARGLRLLRLDHVFADADLVVQCGTPMMWPECYRAEWLPALWGDVLARSGGPPVLNLAAGSCYPWRDARPPDLSRADRAALTTLLTRADLTTFRDGLARDVANQVGADGPILPCTAMHWAHGTHGDVDAEGVILNVMPRGGHFDWGQNLDESDWHREIDATVASLEKAHPLIVLCHDEVEYDFARRWPEHERHLVTTPSEYLAVARRGRVGVVNRMHAAVALAGLGIPAVAIGTDTRLLMVEAVGQDTVYLGDVTMETLVETVAILSSTHLDRRTRLIQIEADAFAAHAGEVSAVLGLAVSDSSGVAESV
jgi:hypothetical protein